MSHFGKRNGSEPAFGKSAALAREPATAPPRAAAPAAAPAPAPAPAATPAPAPGVQMAPQASKPVAKVVTDSRSEDYYQIKSTIFNALDRKSVV